MHDLRRQALESGKTVSRKARSKQNSASSSHPSSPATSRAASRNPSRNASSDEEGGGAGDVSDDGSTQWSSNSIDELLATPAASDDNTDAPADAWKAELAERMDRIVARKKSSAQSREENLSAYAHILAMRYARAEISGRIGEILPAVLKSVKAGTTEKEVVAALKGMLCSPCRWRSETGALALTLITDPSDAIHSAVQQPLKQTITDSPHASAKAAATHALGVATFYGGAASPEETQEVLDFLLEIVETDGGAAEAADDAALVTAALEEWGLLATAVEDMEEPSEAAMEAFVDQLDAADVRVQIAAGENIALLYEKSYTELESDEEEGGDEEEGSASDSDHSSSSSSSFSSPPSSTKPHNNTAASGPKMKKRYTPYRRPDTLQHTLRALSKVSSRQLSKRDRKALHANFADILHAVRHPTRGPRYRTALCEATGREYGSGMVLRVGNGGRGGVLRVDTWAKLLRLRALRRVLGAGVAVHLMANEGVFEVLPVVRR
ncbi:hypothetical protein LTR66_004421 [Elasticomyces elasticus]|nr:hypothetical protein LTR66_004421 [Elasticomyces elasticus]